MANEAMSIRQFLFELASNPDLLNDYQDPDKRERVLKEHLPDRFWSLFADASAIEVRYMVEVEAANVPEEELDPTVRITSKVPIYPPPIY